MVMIEMYEDWVEILNFGFFVIDVNWFIDEYCLCNDCFVDLMCWLYICEEKGSGIDKVIEVVEVF